MPDRVANKPSGHCCTHSMTIAGMLAEPIGTLLFIYNYDKTNTNYSNSYCTKGLSLDYQIFLQKFNNTMGLGSLFP